MWSLGIEINCLGFTLGIACNDDAIAVRLMGGKLIVGFDLEWSAMSLYKRL
jgi:hypothetical protein